MFNFHVITAKVSQFKLKQDSVLWFLLSGKLCPGHRIISWKSEDESHVIENVACNSTS